MSFTISWSLVKLMSIESVMPSNHLIHFLEDIIVQIYVCQKYIFIQIKLYLYISIYLIHHLLAIFYLSVIFLSIYLSFVYSVQLLSHVQLFEIPCTAALQASLSITSSWSLPKLMSNELVMPSNHLILCHPLLLPPSPFSASGSFQMSQFFTTGGQSIGVSTSTSVLPMNTQY